jgi:hypothetical protein
MKKGYGAGFYSAVELRFLDPYEAIDKRKIYCGTKEVLPAGYDRQGNTSGCFQKGYATGKRQRALLE